MYWVFYLVVTILPVTEPPEVLVKEPFTYFSSREVCEEFQEWWNDNHTHLRATPCQRVFMEAMDATG